MTLFESSAAEVQRVMLVVAYDGAPFHGFAENAGVATVAGTLRRSLERVLRHDVELSAAGRTDAGVHALGQVVTFDARAGGLDLVRLQRSVNALCAPSIVVRSAEVVAPDLDARFSARWRRYRYCILNRNVPDPFLAATSWHLAIRLDRTLLELACDPLIGEHDFSSFCRKPRVGEDQPAPTMVRRVLDAGWQAASDDLLHFEIRATAFCQQMVRSITGTLVEIGLGKRRPGDVLTVLRARDRVAAASPAPPHGLFLVAVGYEG